MKLRPFFYVTLALSIGFLTAAAPTHKLEPVEKAPDGLSEKIAAAIDPAGRRVVGPDGPVVEIWLVKELAVKPGFKPTLMIKYPLTQGQLVGALRIPEKAKFTDFRGQEIGPGVYTLRYGKQPQDGNHIGTSELSDFVVAIPAKVDHEPEPIDLADTLHMKSARSAGSTHPAIYSLLPPEKGDKEGLVHDDGHDFWILNVTADGKADGKATKVPLRLVVIGRALE